MGKLEYLGKKPIRCSANTMILILMRVSLPSKLRKTVTTKERGRDAHIHSIVTWTHSMHIWGEISFIKPQNNT